MSFNCDKCGECCRNLNTSELYADLDSGDGSCIYLKGNLCSIYDKRPKKCRVDECYEYFAHQMSREQYYELNYRKCKELKEKKIIGGDTNVSETVEQ